MIEKTEVSIIIVNYKTACLTVECIKSIYKNISSCSFEIILVDNASNDESINIFQETFGSNITLIQSEENLGFGRANNLGAKYASGKYIFLLNSDTILLNDPLKEFIEFYKTESCVGVLGTYLIDGGGVFTQSGGKFYSPAKYLKMALNGILRRKTAPEVKDNKQVQKVDYVIGADMFISRDLFLEVGGFDPNIFMYVEDVELCKRISQKGYSNYLLPGHNIVHFVKSSSTSQFSKVYNTASLMYCMRKDKGLIEFRIFQALYFLMKLPLLFNIPNFRNEWQYISTIYNYKKYLVDKLI